MSSERESILWTTIARIADEEGAELFDLELPSSQHSSESEISSGAGVFRVFITRSSGAAPLDEVQHDTVEESSPKRLGVSLDQCAQVCRRLLDLDEQQPFVPEGCELEVSSPGINRRLRRPEHFVKAVDERVKIKFRNDKGGTQVVTGVVKSCDGASLSIAAEGGAGSEIQMRLADIKEARVDFQFG
jgi:ribosome maturation factor RimP